MTGIHHSEDLPWLIETYFSDSDRRLFVKKGDVLMEEGGINDCLYLVLKGVFSGSFRLPEGGQYQLFSAVKHNFIGVYSFFSKKFISSATVIAEEDSEVAYINQNQPIQSGRIGNSLFEQFMPVVISHLARRQQREREIALEKEKTLKKLIHTEKLASLGQMAAGLAHELNNAIAVLERNTEWISTELTRVIDRDYPLMSVCFVTGIKKGRALSSREVREKASVLKKTYDVSDETARKMAEMDLSEQILAAATDDLNTWSHLAHYFWELGATFHDMSIASRHASTVVKSVKALAVQKSPRHPDVDVNESIRDTLALLSSPLRKINVKTIMKPLPLIVGNKSELVQVWANLIKNGIDSMSSLETGLMALEIKSAADRKKITVSIADNGSGIPEHMRSKIMQPNFTTKERGLDFGLGLGLTIVERIVSSYSGDIRIDSAPGRTCFTVHIPLSGNL